MKANELRVGNWVCNDFTLEDIEVYPMMIHRLSKIEGEHHIKPIPLTEDWLIKFGFKPVKNGVEIKVIEEYVKINSFFNGKPLTLEIDGRRAPLRNIKYVHQLQNLYFALTGEELEIKD